MIDEKVLIERLEEAGKYHLELSEANKMDVRESHRHKQFAGVYGHAIKIVKDLAESYHIHCEQEYMKGYEDGAESVRAMMPYEEHNNGWISVEDALPEEYADVLGYSQEGHTYLCRLYESKIFGKVWKQWNGGDMRFDWIVAWQPLPAPCKKGE